MRDGRSKDGVVSRKTPDFVKTHGVHYTPPALAAFLAEVTAAAVRPGSGPPRILDPACGEGGLLVAFANALPKRLRGWLTIEGYETDAEELGKAEASLARLGASKVILHNRDFLLEVETGTGTGTRRAEDEVQRFDLIIANPPYVRTQVLGAKKSQALSRQFGLTGRVDLYHAFAMAMTAVLKPGGVLGLLTSNRFLTTRSGASLRAMFSSLFEIEAIYDLGDTKLFSAAVLPVIIVARKGQTQSRPGSEFHRIYEHRNDPRKAPARRDSILSALREKELSGLVQTPSGTFSIQRGRLVERAHAWSLSNCETNGWLEKVAARQVHAFGDLAQVRVGIKSTADEVFVRDDWRSLPAGIRPEAELLHPLLTHREAARWLPEPAARQVLYPHVMSAGKRSAIELAAYPRAAAYFTLHKARLSRRTYVIEAGRKWYEIWVPHHPDNWAKPKIAYPDISEHPRFFFDASGAIIQGDCYWITLKDGIEPDWLLLMLAVANSTLIAKYYDAMFHNKLYAGRRRFMTQYVARFPLPELAACRRIVEEVAKLLKRGKASDAVERKIDGLVWEAFGLSEEIPGRAEL